MTKKGARETTRVELSNSYHGTATRILVPSGLIDPAHDPAHQMATAWEWLQHQAQMEYSAPGRKARHPAAGYRHTLSRVRRELCGIDDCTCGTVR